MCQLTSLFPPLHVYGEPLPILMQALNTLAIFICNLHNVWTQYKFAHVGRNIGVEYFYDIVDWWCFIDFEYLHCTHMYLLMYTKINSNINVQPISTAKTNSWVCLHSNWNYVAIFWLLSLLHPWPWAKTWSIVHKYECEKSHSHGFIPRTLLIEVQSANVAVHIMSCTCNGGDKEVNWHTEHFQC